MLAIPNTTVTRDEVWTTFRRTHEARLHLYTFWHRVLSGRELPDMACSVVLLTATAPPAFRAVLGTGEVAPFVRHLLTYYRGQRKISFGMPEPVFR